MTDANTIVFRSDNLKALLLALRDTFGPGLAKRACLLFTKHGLDGNYIDRSDILSFDESLEPEGPIVALIESDNPDRAITRLQFMASPMHGYGEQPELVTEEKAMAIIRDARAKYLATQRRS